MSICCQPWFNVSSAVMLFSGFIFHAQEVQPDCLAE